MQFKLARTSVPLSKSFIISFFLLMWLCIEAHEFSHYTAIIVQGGKFYASLDMWWLVKGSLNDVQSLIAWTAGPLMTFTLMWIGLFMILKSKRYELLGFSLISASLPFARVNPLQA